MTTETFNPHTLPYKLEVTRPEYAVPPVPMLHNLMCDLTKKIPEIRFQTNGVQRWPSENINKGDDYYVYAGTEKVGNIWRSVEYRNGTSTEVFNLSSERITAGRRGKKNTKVTKHFKVALRAATAAFAPYEMGTIAAKIVSTVDDGVSRIAARALSQIAWTVQQQLALEFAGYITDVKHNGPQPLPHDLVSKLPHGWDEKVNTCKIATAVKDECKSIRGVALKLMPDGMFVAVSVNGNEVVAMGSNPYDLPAQYQDKFAILKMMEKDQPVLNVGVKFVESGDVTYFYLTDGDLLEQGATTT